MDDREIEELMEDVASVMKSFVASAVSPLEAEIARLNGVVAAFAVEREAAAPNIDAIVSEAVGRVQAHIDERDAFINVEAVNEIVRQQVAHAIEKVIIDIPAPPELPDISALVRAAVEAIPPPAPGKDADPEVIRQMVADAVALIPAAKDGEPGKDADPALVEQLVAEKVAEAIAEIPPAPAGKDADPEVTAELVRVEVDRAVAAIPAPQDGKSVTVEELDQLVEETVAKAVAALPAAEKGDPGAPGALPIVKAWTDDVTHEGEVRTYSGATWQATKDTAKEPPHADWVCLAAAGEAGQPARQIVVRGTYSAEGEYAALDIVALNGGAFIARKDDPGTCPGEGWQVIAMRGKPGEPGKRGDPGPSVKGPPGAPVVAAHIDDQGLLMLVNGDGSTVECDLYPVLAKVQ